MTEKQVAHAIGLRFAIYSSPICRKLVKQDFRHCKKIKTCRTLRPIENYALPPPPPLPLLPPREVAVAWVKEYGDSPPILR